MFKLQSKVTPFLWYDHQAGDAAALYIELFGNGRIVGLLILRTGAR